MKSVASLRLMLYLVGAICGAEDRTLDPGIQIERMESESGAYLVIYNYVVSDNSAVSDEDEHVKCQWVSFILEDKFTTLPTSGPLLSLPSIDCQTDTDQKIGPLVHLKRQPRSYTFYTATLRANFPHDYGVLYLINKNITLTYNGIRRVCPYSKDGRRMPFTKTTHQKEQVRAVLKERNIEAVFVGTREVDHSSDFNWDDNAPFTEKHLVVNGIGGRGNLAFTKDGRYRILQPEEELFYFCLINPLGANWDQ